MVMPGLQWLPLRPEAPEPTLSFSTRTTRAPLRAAWWAVDSPADPRRALQVEAMVEMWSYSKPLDDVGELRGLDAHEPGRATFWQTPQDDRARTEVVDAFTTAITTGVNVVAVTLDPESVYFVGRLRPLVEEVLPEVRKRLDRTLPAVPRITTAAQVLGLSTARGAVTAGLAMTHNRLRDVLLRARSQGRQQEQSAPAF
jgi:hypothetical protein